MSKFIRGMEITSYLYDLDIHKILRKFIFYFISSIQWGKNLNGYHNEFLLRLFVNLIIRDSYINKYNEMKTSVLLKNILQRTKLPVEMHENCFLKTTSNVFVNESLGNAKEKN